MRAIRSRTSTSHGGTGTVDPATLRLLQKYLDELRRYRSRRARKPASRPGRHPEPLNELYIAVMAMVDLACHGAAADGQPRAASPVQALERLAAAGRINSDLAARLRTWIEIRAMIARHHARHPADMVLGFQRPTLDHQRIATAIVYGLPDLEEFAAAAAAWK